MTSTRRSRRIKQLPHRQDYAPVRRFLERGAFWILSFGLTINYVAGHLQAIDVFVVWAKSLAAAIISGHVPGF